MAGLPTLNSVTTLTGRDHVITIPETSWVLDIWDKTRSFYTKMAAGVEELPAKQEYFSLSTESQSLTGKDSLTPQDESQISL